MDALITLGKPARFGRGEDTVTDPEVRDTWEPGVLDVVLDTLKEELGLPNAAELQARRRLHLRPVRRPHRFPLPPK